MAGLIKAALVAKHGFIPANLHLGEPTRHVSLEELKIDVPPATGRPFPPAAERRVVGVNSFGFGGTNAHVVLAEPPVMVGAEVEAPKLPAVLPISARSEEALVATADRLAEHLDAHPGLTLPNLQHTLARRRSHLNHRSVVIAENIDDARQQLRALADGGPVAGGRIVGSAPPQTAFVCTGMGPQWWKMCRGLLDVLPSFTDSILRTDRELSQYTGGWSLVDELRRDETSTRMGGRPRSRSRRTLPSRSRWPSSWPRTGSARTR